MAKARHQSAARHVADILSTIINANPFRKGPMVKASDLLRGQSRGGNSNVLQVPFSKLLDIWCPPPK